MKHPNGYGSITKMSGNRRNPFRVRITCGWEIVNGESKQKRKTLGYYSTKREAMMALAKYNENPYDVDMKTVTFDEIYQKWIVGHAEKHPVAAQGLASAYKKCVPLYNMRMTEIRKMQMQEIMNACSDMSLSYQTKIKTIFKGVFKFAIENDIVEKDYSAFVEFTTKEQTEEKIPFTKAEIKKIFDNIDLVTTFPLGRKQYTEIQLMDSIVVMLYSGIRIGELLDLKVSDIYLDKKYIDLQGTKTPSAKRIVPIHEKIIPIIEKWVAKGNENLFANTNGKPIKYDTYKKHFFDATMELLGMNHTPHVTRHTFVSAMDETGVNSVTLKRIIGHANKDVTERYTHKDIEQLLKAINKLEY